MSVTRLHNPPPAAQSRPTTEGEVYNLSRAAETGFERIQRLQAEARMLAREEIESLSADLAALAGRAAQIADGGDAYPPGVREMASRLANDLPNKAQNIRVISERMASGR